MPEVQPTPEAGAPSRQATAPEREPFLVELWRLASPYFRSDDWLRGNALLLCVMALNFGNVGVSVLLNQWSARFYNSFETRSEGAFFEAMADFSWLAAIFISVGVAKYFTEQELQLRWRRWLTRRYLGNWLSEHAYYRIEIAGTADNPDQRIAEDLRLMPEYSIELGMGILSAAGTLVSFIFILWSLSGPLAVAFGPIDTEIPGYLVWVALIYATAGTWLANLVGRRLIPLNFGRQKLEADFRFGLVRVRENAEAVALYSGEPRERTALSDRFDLVLDNWWQIIVARVRYIVYSVGYSQVAVVFPFLVASPRFFAGAITLGTLMQISQSFGQVQTALSFFITRYADIAEWRAVMNRLRGFEEAIGGAVQAPGGPAIQPSAAQSLAAEAVSLELPNGTVLARDATFSVAPGERVLVSGPSGAGKSTLFRALSGIWPYGDGTVRVPEGTRALFLPQKPYLPIGTLSEAVRYPDVETPVSDAAVRGALEDVGLGHLGDRLHEVAHWGNRLSGGEQQRLAAARALLYRPDWLFLDEASSSLDEPAEKHIHELLRERLPHTGIVSIGHRSELRQWHERHLELVPGDGKPGHLVEVPA